LPARLDSEEFLLANDKKGLMAMALGFPNQCREALSLSKLENAQKLSGKRNVVICGMGGSAIGGDFLRCLFETFASVPLIVCRDYELPTFVNEDTLLIACSYSGNTEETLSALRQGIKRGCSVVAVTSGGEVAAICGKHDFPIIRVPSGLPPRMSLGYLFVPLVVIAVSAGYLPEQDMEVTFAELDSCIERWGPSRPATTNAAKTLAGYLFGRVPLVYGLGSWQGVVASRWKGQINENAKVMCFAHTFPELNHNEIMGWTLAERQNVAHWATIFLESGDESVRMQTRAKVTRDLIREKSETFTIGAHGETLLSQMLTLAFCGDFVSLYLAALNGVDPENIDSINTLKKTLSELDR
jgi:glucose/mannose-6-phosphate isomerase